MFIIAGLMLFCAVNTALLLTPSWRGCSFFTLTLGSSFTVSIYVSFEGQAAVLAWLGLFLRALFIAEVSLILAYGVDYRMIEAPYIGRSVSIGPIGISLRLGVPCGGIAAHPHITSFLAKTFYGKYIMAVSQRQPGARLMGANPAQIKTIAFGLGMARRASLVRCSLSLSLSSPPWGGNILPGLRHHRARRHGGIGGTLAAALLLGVAESLTSTFSGPSWAPGRVLRDSLISPGRAALRLFGR